MDKAFGFTVGSLSFTLRLNEEVKDSETGHFGRNNLRINHTDIVYTVYKQLLESLARSRTFDSAHLIIALRVEPKPLFLLPS